MTGAEWLTCAHLRNMRESLEGKASERKLRLCAVACCRTVLNDSWPQRCREVIDSVELFADGLLTDDDLNRARSLACQSAQNAWFRGSRGRFGHQSRIREGWFAFAADAAQRQGLTRFIVNPSHVIDDTSFQQLCCVFLRDIFGNPFCPVPFSPDWQTSTAVLLAQTMYEERNFGNMPILADALEDAGCSEASILDHCRLPGTHVRGCWVVDLVLGKS